MSEGSVSLDMEARRLAILSSHLCPLGSGQPRGRTPIPLFSALSFSYCASGSGETQRFRDSEEKDRQNDCVFCKIVRGESPALKLYEDDACLCILDTNPLSHGHSLIIPKSHFCSLKATPPHVIAAMCSKVPFISSAIMKATGCVRADHLWHQLASSLWNLLGFKRLYEMKLVRLQLQQLLSRMCEAANTQEYIDETIMSIIVRAISRGNFEFVYQIVKANSGLLRICDSIEGRGIFHWAVLHRQHRIFSLIYSLKMKNNALQTVDNSLNYILHIAGMLIEHTPINHIRGAALQMQREVQWFKEVERMCPPYCNERLNIDGLTPKQLFIVTHKKLKEKGEKWMKNTATSCTVVGTLIITIMFAAAFTIPGSNNQDTGLPILVHDKLFTLFIVTNSVSLFSSSTSVLMFLEILTSRYAEEDFLIPLPKKMIIGLFALFFSIATMLIAFSTALLLMLHGKFWIVVPIIGLSGVPILLFVLMQFRLLIDMLVSTCGLGIFDRKMKPWF